MEAGFPLVGFSMDFLLPPFQDFCGGGAFWSEASAWGGASLIANGGAREVLARKLASKKKVAKFQRKFV